MKKYNKAIGYYGENIAEEWLVKNNYKIIQRNFRCKLGEIDIVAYDEEYICFIEVKTRYEYKFGTPSEAVNSIKKNRIKKTALYYIYINNCRNQNYRFDVVEVMLNRKNTNNNTNIIKNAFM